MKKDNSEFPVYQPFILIVLMAITFFAGDYLALILRIHGTIIAYPNRVILTAIWHLIIVLTYILALIITERKRASLKFNYFVVYGGFFLAINLSLFACGNMGIK